MEVFCSQKQDIRAWLDLAREVEHLFGPMADEKEFLDALANAIDAGYAFCIKDADSISSLVGGIVIDPVNNEIVWLAVSGKYRKKNVGNLLLNHAIEQLDSSRPIIVVTFAASVEEGIPARKLYTKYDFKDKEAVGENPAGIPIVLMVRSANNE